MWWDFNVLLNFGKKTLCMELYNNTKKNKSITLNHQMCSMQCTHEYWFAMFHIVLSCINTQYFLWWRLPPMHLLYKFLNIHVVICTCIFFSPFFISFSSRYDWKYHSTSLSLLIDFLSLFFFLFPRPGQAHTWHIELSAYSTRLIFFWFHMNTMHLLDFWLIYRRRTNVTQIHLCMCTKLDFSSSSLLQRRAQLFIYVHPLKNYSFFLLCSCDDQHLNVCQ